MIVRLGSHSASAVVATPWNPVVDTLGSHYATITVRSEGTCEPSLSAELTNLHPDTKAFEKYASRTNVTVTLWAPSSATLSATPPLAFRPPDSMSKASQSKSFRPQWTSSVPFPSWPSAILLAVANVLDEKTQASFCHILVALSSHTFSPTDFSIRPTITRHTLALLRIESTQVVHTTYINLHEDEVPLNALVLRGPVVLFVSDNAVHAFNASDTTECNIIAKDRQVVVSSTTPPVIGATERDNLALVLSSSGEGWLLTSVKIIGTAISARITTMPHSFFPAQPILMYGTCLIISFVVVCDNGSVLLMDIRSSSRLRTMKNPLLIETSVKEFSDVTIRDNIAYLASTYPSNKLFTFSLGVISDTSVTVPTLITAFPECRLLSSVSGTSMKESTASHGHFYTFCRGRLLMINAMSGTCCHEYEENTHLKESPVFSASSDRKMSPSVDTMVANLRKRTDTGVQAYMHALLANVERRRMLHHTVGLLADVVRAPTISPRNGVLETRLQRVVTRLDNRISLSKPKSTDPTFSGEVKTNIDAEMMDTTGAIRNYHDKKPFGPFTPLCLWVSGQSFLDAPVSFLRISRAHCTLDHTQTYVVVDVDAQFLPLQNVGLGQETKMDETNQFTLFLGLRIDQCTSSSSNVTIHRNLTPGSNVANIRATVPLADIVTASGSLDDVQLSVRAHRSDGRSQHLGQFSMRHLLSLHAKYEKGTALPHAFERDVYVIAEGRNAHRIDLKSPSLYNCATEVFRLEGIICVILRVTTGVDLASAATRLKLAFDDKVLLRWTPKLHRSTIAPINSAVAALENEMQYFRSVAAPSDAIGYSSKQVEEIMLRQLQVDEALGTLEELFGAL